MAEWIKDSMPRDGMLMREFTTRHCADSLVPAVLFQPRESAGLMPLVLIGHGGSQYKTHPGIIDAAYRWVQLGFCALAIDGPIHGARRSDGRSGLEIQAEFREMWAQDHRIDAMVADWQAALDDVLRSVDCVHSEAIGWYGPSMGTAYGIPFIAKEPRVRAAGLGMLGSDFMNGQRILDDAPRVRCPLLFQQKWNDQFFSREGQVDLFDRLGSTEKFLKVYPGEHVPVEGEQLDDVVDFLHRRLRALAG